MIQTFLRIVATCILLSWFTAAPVLAQVNPEIANCEEVKDEATQTQIDFCTAHAGCKLVMGIQNTCAKVKTFIERLREKVGDGTRSLFGTRRTVDATQVYGALEAMAAEPPAYKKSALTEKWKQAAQSAEKDMKSMSKDSVTEEETLTGGLFGRKIDTPNLARYTYKENGKTTKLVFIKDKSGEVTASQFSLDENNRPTGAATAVSTSGEKALFLRSGANDPSILHASKNGDISEGIAENFRIGSIGAGKFFYNLTQGQYTFADGTYFVGRASIGEKMNPIEGVQYTKDGKKMMEGLFREGRLAEGKTYGSDGKVTSNITTLSDERRVTRAKIEREQAEAKRVAIEQQKKDIKAKQEEDAYDADLKASEKANTKGSQRKYASVNPLGYRSGNLYIVHIDKLDRIILVSARSEEVALYQAKYQVTQEYRRVFPNSAERELAEMSFRVINNCSGPNWGAIVKYEDKGVPAQRTYGCGAATPEQAIRDAIDACSKKSNRSCSNGYIRVEVGASGEEIPLKTLSNLRVGLAQRYFYTLGNAYFDSVDAAVSGIGKMCPNRMNKEQSYACYESDNSFACSVNAGTQQQWNSCLDRTIGQ